MYEITDIFARQIIDSRGNPTVEVDILTPGGMGRAAVPSGASTGSREALELRDGKKKVFRGKGVLKAIDNVNDIIAPELIGMDCREQRAIDMFMCELDAELMKKRKAKGIKAGLGANAILGVSLAAARAAAETSGEPLYRYIGGNTACVLPVPAFNVINGGAHGGNELSIQEHMIMPIGAGSFAEAMQMGVEVYHELGAILKKKYGPTATNLGDEGGFAPPLTDAQEPFHLIEKAITSAGYSKKDIAIAVDSAASEFYDAKKKVYTVQKKKFSTAGLVDFYADLAKAYNIVSFEDPFGERDMVGFTLLTEAIGDKIQIMGDDIYVTNTELLCEGIKKRGGNALLLKVNQIGTLSESLDAAQMAFRAGWGVMVSHRSGETTDATIADLTVAIGAGQIKTGAPARGERLAKYNQLLRIEEELGPTARYAGRGFRNPYA